MDSWALRLAIRFGLVLLESDWFDWIGLGSADLAWFAINAAHFCLNLHWRTPRARSPSYVPLMSCILSRL